MKCDLANLLRQASSAINPRNDRGGYAYMLEQVADHIDDVKFGRHSLTEFAEFYKIKGAEL
jgi:hypothetical protein